jgi:general secretion pathway protein H
VRRVRASRYGFSLIEVLVVIAIVGLIAYSMLTSMGVAGQAELTRATNQTATTIRCAFDRARTTGYYYRMRFDFEQRSISLQRADDRMYMPSTDRDGEIVAFDPKKEKDREARDLRAAESYNRSLQSKIVDAGDVAMEGDEAAPYDPWAPQVKEVPRRKPPLFESFEEENTLSGIGEPIVFPEDVRILSVRTEHDREAITEGEAFLYFFPMGRTQLAHIQLRSEDGADEYTIKVQPLTGKVTVVPELEELELPDRVGEGEDELGEKQQRRSF